MPRNERTIDLSAEYDRLDKQVREYASEYASAADGSRYQQLAVTKGNRAERHRRGVAWALDYPDSDASGSGWDTQTLALGELTKGDRNLIDHTLDEIDCTEQDAYCALVVMDAPFVEHDAADPMPTLFKRTIRNITGLDPAFVDWIDHRAGEIASAGDTGKSFMGLVMDEASATSDETNG